jgi:hypothetical protein
MSHKRCILEKYRRFGTATQSFFDNKHQAWYLVTKRSDLVPPDGSPGQPPSIHTLGTIFEFNFETSLEFRFGYLDWLPNELEEAPKIEVFKGLSFATLPI